MADNTIIEAVVDSGETIATDDISGVKYPRTKLIHGADGVNDGDVSTVNPLPVNANLSADGTQNVILSRYLDTVGDGSGIKSANADYLGGSTFSLAPPGGTVYRICSMVVFIEDVGSISADKYGADIALSNGIEVRISDTGGIINVLTDEVNIFTNSDWAKHTGASDKIDYGTGPEIAVARWDFEKSHGQYIRLDGDDDEVLEVFLDDDFSGLTDHTFFVQGYIESTAT